MLDISLIRSRADELKRVCVQKNKDPMIIDELLAIDDRRRSIQKNLDDLRFAQKKAGEAKDIQKAKELKEEIQKLEQEQAEILKKYDELMLKVPNFVHPSVPVGKDDTENVVVEVVGEKPSFAFEPKSYLELLALHDMADFERGVKIAGTRGYFLKNDGVLLERAVLNYAMDVMIKKGFTPFSVPHIVNPECLVGTGYFPGGEEDAFWLERDNKWLIATAEIPLTAYHMNEILDEKELPKTYVGISPCYRREAGSYGKDVGGLYRIHQFMKVEQVVVLPADEPLSNEWHQKILRNARDVIEGLELPYRVLQLCTGDMAIGKYNSHDLECRMPSRGKYGETHSATSFLDFQARRLNLRYRTKDGEIKYCYTLNNTVVATPRILIALLENHQQADGSIRIPKALQPYMGKEVIQKKE